MRTRRGIAAIAAMAILLCSAAKALAQTGKDILGAWTLLSVVVDQGGTKIEPFGNHPKGSIMFGPSGRFSLVITRSDLPALASNNRLSGTAEENRAIVQGSIAHFGTYSVNEDTRTFTVHVEGSTFPNWVGTDQRRIFSISDDELKYTNSDRSSGTGTALVVWRRAK